MALKASGTQLNRNKSKEGTLCLSETSAHTEEDPQPTENNRMNSMQFVVFQKTVPRVKEVAQLMEYSPSIHKALGFIPACN